MPPMPTQGGRTHPPPSEALQKVATGGAPCGAVKDPPIEGALAVTGRHSTAHVAHGVGYPGAGMDGPGNNSKGYHQHTRHQHVIDPVEGGGGADPQSPPRQPADAQRPPWFQRHNRDRDSYNGVKARPGYLQNRPRPPLHGIPGPKECL